MNTKQDTNNGPSICEDDNVFADRSMYISESESESESDNIDQLKMDINALLMSDGINNPMSNVVYPVAESMFADLNYHGRIFPFVTIHLCAYQIRRTTNNNPILQYILHKTEDTDNVGHPVLGFYNKTIYDGCSGTTNMMDIAWKMMQVIMLGYTKFQTDDCVYKGFHKNDSDFYVFIDVTSVWVNHHYLSTTDPIWLATVTEIVDTRQICDIPVSETTTALFLAHPELQRLLTYNGDVYPSPIVGYTLEEKSTMDWTMSFGSQPSHIDALGDEWFKYATTYDECANIDCDNQMVVMRHALFIDDKLVDINVSGSGDPEQVDPDAMNCRVFSEDGSYVIAIRDHGSQTPLTSHNTAMNV